MLAVTRSVLSCTVVYCTTTVYNVQYCTGMYCTALYYSTVPYFTVLYYSILYYTRLHCEQVPDCPDGSDEWDCPCSGWRCDGGFCVAATARCDGVRHCSDGSDEKDCPSCGPKQFSCARDRARYLIILSRVMGLWRIRK